MRIVRIELDAAHDRPAWQCDSIAPGLNVFYTPHESSRADAADVIGHALYGRRLSSAADDQAVGGELIVDSDRRGFRLRRNVDAAGQTRLTVAAMDGNPVDRGTVRGFFAGLSPELARPIYALPFGRPSLGDDLLTKDFLRKAAAIDGEPRERNAGPRVNLPDRLQALAGDGHHNGTIPADWSPAQLIDDAQRQLVAVQRQLEIASQLLSQNGNIPRHTIEHPLHEASERLAQLTSGRLVGIELHGRVEGVRVRSRDGQLLPPEWLTPAGLNQVRLSVCLALALDCKRRGTQLPLVLDEPFAHVESADVAAMAEMLADMSQHGQQVLLFTGRQAAAERFVASGVAVRRLHPADEHLLWLGRHQIAGDLAAA
jgi:hypothetical protein